MSVLLDRRLSIVRKILYTSFGTVLCGTVTNDAGLFQPCVISFLFFKERFCWRAEGDGGGGQHTASWKPRKPWKVSREQKSLPIQGFPCPCEPPIPHPCPPYTHPLFLCLWGGPTFCWMEIFRAMPLLAKLPPPPTTSATPPPPPHPTPNLCNTENLARFLVFQPANCLLPHSLKKHRHFLGGGGDGVGTLQGFFSIVRSSPPAKLMLPPPPTPPTPPFPSRNTENLARFLCFQPASCLISHSLKMLCQF